MQLTNTLMSNQDKSVNFIFNNLLEARYVRRVDDYFIVYLSSHDGCNKACRFCHLTQTAQTSFNETSLDEYVEQAKTVLSYYDSVIKEQGKAQKVNFNFMARGEPLANSIILNNPEILFNKLEELALERGLVANFNISTIFPKEVEELKLEDIFKNVTQSYGIYYSLYSVDPTFRKQWLPKALDYNLALKKLESLQMNTDANVVFHWTFIKGKNDSQSDLEDIKNVLSNYNINAKFNLVRYNPYSEKQGEESDETVLQNNFNNFNDYFKHPHSRIVPRVGFDVKASCGMFVKQD